MDLRPDLAEDLAIALIDEAVGENALALVEPDPHKLDSALIVETAVCVKKPLEDVGHVPQVELVVEFRRRGQETRRAQDEDHQCVNGGVHEGLLLGQGIRGLVTSVMDHCRALEITHESRRRRCGSHLRC